MSKRINCIRWSGDPVECNPPCSFNLNIEKSTFYKSVSVGKQLYSIGEFALLYFDKKEVIGRLLYLYNSKKLSNTADHYRGIVHLYKYPEDVKFKNKFNKSFDNNELIDCNIQEDISLHAIVDKAAVVFGAEDDTTKDIQPEQYLVKYKVINSTLVPIILDFQVPETILKDSDSVNTPKQKNSHVKSVRTVDHYSNKRKTTKDHFYTPIRKLNVKRNLNESFGSIPNSQENMPNLNYSLVERIENDQSIKLKLRISRSQSCVPLEILDDKVLNKLLNKQEEEDKMSDKLGEEDVNKINDENMSVRRSARIKRRVSYAEYLPITPIKSIRNIDEVLTPRSTRSRKNLLSEDVSPKKIMKMEPLEESPRKRKTPSKYNDYNCYDDFALTLSKSPIKHALAGTPKKTKVSNCKSEVAPKTPKKAINDVSPNTPKTPYQKIPPMTPKSKISSAIKTKMIKEGLITPSVHSRMTPIKAACTPLSKAKTTLHVSYVPEVLVCREKEFSDVFNFIEGKLVDGCGGCMYISGVPGTGKTATVTEVIKKLQVHVKLREVPDFEFIFINGMKLSEPRQAYVEIYKQLDKKTVKWQDAQSLLDKKFTKTGNKNKAIVLLIDELDILCTRRQDVVYNLLDWPTKAKAQLIVITIANTMDLPERLLMGRVTSRLGLTRLTFQAYTHKQLQEIVVRRLIGTDTFNSDAVQLVARKVASISGDARRALDICRRAAEIAETKGDNTLVSMNHVSEALNSMITQPKVRAIKHCSKLQQLILQAVVSEVERTGVEETTFIDVYTMLVSIASIDGFQMVTYGTAMGAVSKLGACRLLLLEQTLNDMHQKIILNVSADEVYYALRKD